jgi:mono/diheme cytochrome c family protein
MKRIAFALLSASAVPLSPAPAAGQGASSPSLTPVVRVRVERALEQRFACLGCHRIGGRGGSIGPILDGIGERADYEYVLAMIRDPSGTVSGTIMPRHPMPAREAERLAAYLVSLPPAAPPADIPAEAPPALMPSDSLDGGALYARHCAACHGESGDGDGWNAANLPVQPTAHADPALMSERPDDTLYDAIAAGGYVLDKSTRMPAFREMLSREQIRALVAHIRVLCDCSQPTWAGDGG